MLAHDEKSDPTACVCAALGDTDLLRVSLRAGLLRRAILRLRAVLRGSLAVLLKHRANNNERERIEDRSSAASHSPRVCVSGD